MTRDEALTVMSTILGFRGDLSSTAPAMLKVAQEHFERGPTYPWFLLVEDDTLVTVDATRAVAVPTDFITEYEEGGLYYDTQVADANLVALTKDDNDYLMAFYGSADTGVPESYSLDGMNFNIFPLPDDAYSLNLQYYKHDADVSSISGSATNLWLTHAPNCLIGYAGKLLASGYRDLVAQSMFSNMESEARQLLLRQNEERKHANRSYQVGGTEA